MRGSRHKAIGKRLRNALFDNKTFGGGADLSGVLIASGNCGFYRQFEIGIIEYNKRIRAPSSSTHFFSAAPA